MSKQFSSETVQKIKEVITHFPTKRAALLPVLRMAEEEWGYLDEPACEVVARYLEISPAHVYGVLSFYTHFKRAWHGRYRIMFCRTLMCDLRGGAEIFEHIQKKLGISSGERTVDGLFSLEKVECLASCGTAPAMQINENYYENLSPEKVNEILENLSQKPIQNTINKE